MAPIQDCDPKDLSSSGWGIIFAPEVDPEVRDALFPLLDLRREQAGSLFRQFECQQGRSKQEFLLSHGAGPGPADPRKVPYYLLIVGDPRTISFRFQYELDVQYAVGRIWFDRPDDYASYARSVVRAESKPPLRPRRLVFFGPANHDDLWTQRSSRALISALANSCLDNRSCETRLLLGSAATKSQLGRLFGGGETPSLLFAASQGLWFPDGHTRQLADQGGLVCQEWPGPRAWRGEILREHYFSAEDINEVTDLHGLIAFLFASFGGGAYWQDDYPTWRQNEVELSSKYPFIARLPQRLLSDPRGGALAVVSPIDRVWTTSLSWKEDGEDEGHEVWESVLRRLLEGHPIGSAMEYVGQRHAELSVELSGLFADFRGELKNDRDLFLKVWRANGDARNLVVLGDPAARLTSRV